MTHILTFIASDKPLKDRHIKEAIQIMAYYDIAATGKPVWLAKNKAADLAIPRAPGSVLLAHLRDAFNEYKIDILATPAQNRRKKLLLADMDSTIVTGETLDDLAEYAGIKNKIAAITALAMEGKLDFHDALKERVVLLKGLPESALLETLDHMSLSPGAESFVQTMKAGGALCVLVSGGFTFFTGAVAGLAGFDHHHGNTLEIAGGQLTGHVIPPILDKQAKVELLELYCENNNFTYNDVLAIGDGANDIPMLKKAGLGIGYRPKHAVEQEVTNFIRHGDLTAALYAQGYSGLYKA